MTNPLKMFGDLNALKKKAKTMQQQLAAEEIRVEEGDFLVVITGSQEIKQFSVQGVVSEEAVKVLNKAIKQSQKIAAKKLQGMMGGAGGMGNMLGGGSK